MVVALSKVDLMGTPNTMKIHVIINLEYERDISRNVTLIVDNDYTNHTLMRLNSFKSFFDF